MTAYSTYTNEELLSLLKQDDSAAYTTIFYRYNSLLYIHAYKKLRNAEEAKDVVQEIFATLWYKRAEIPYTSNFAGYLYTCIHHKVLDKIVHEKSVSKYTDHLQAFLITTYNDTDDLVRLNQLTEIIEKEIAALPIKMRQVFELSRKHYLSHKEIAEQLDISQETVKSQIKNALKILRVKLGSTIIMFFL